MNVHHMHNLRHVTGLGWGGDVLTSMLICLHHMHNLRHVTGLGWGGDVNVHVNLRHMHNLRHVTGLGWGGDVNVHVNVHVNLRHMHNLRNVTGLRHRLKHPCTDTTQFITCGRNWESWPRRVDAEQLARVS